MIRAACFNTLAERNYNIPSIFLPIYHEKLYQYRPFKLYITYRTFTPPDTSVTPNSANVRLANPAPRGWVRGAWFDLD